MATMRYINHNELKRLGFAWIAQGIWADKHRGLSVAYDDGYCTYYAYASPRPDYTFVVRNKAGNVKHYRTAQAAAQDVVLQWDAFRAAAR